MTSTMMSGVGRWQKSASLIILARTSEIVGNDPNYKVLGFKRPEKTTFMPNHTVFPGGACDPADQLSEWLGHFKNLGVTDRRLSELTKIENSKSRPPIFQTSEKDILKKEISLRITAIRETFEELGVLICRKKHEIEKDNIHGSFEEYFDREKWQKTVHGDSRKFLNLCQKLEVVPDLWSLYEWSVWLTPATFKKRFETAFFVVTLDKVPEVFAEKTEVIDYFWKSPGEFLYGSKNSEFWLPPPQVYELSRLSKLKDIDAVARFAKEQNDRGSTALFPAVLNVSDGLINSLEGDDLHPENPSECTEASNKYANETMESVRIKAKRIHRVELKADKSVECYINFKQFNGHLSPVLDEVAGSKL